MTFQLHLNHLGRPALALYRHNFFSKSSPNVPVLSSIPAPGKNDLIRSSDVFTSLANFQGARISVTAMPWSTFVNGDKVNTDPTHVWGNHWGFEVINM